MNSMEFDDKVLKCVDCGSDFLFTAGEQSFFREKNLQHEPKRCRRCKANRVNSFAAEPGGGFYRVDTHAICSMCNKETIVPFRPTQGRPVLCSACYGQKRHQASA
jgi:CxxC-x17-CxxC domain-containing protein